MSDPTVDFPPTRTWQAEADRLWSMPEMEDPRPDQSIDDWINRIPYRGQWVIPGVLARLVKRARTEAAPDGEALYEEKMRNAILFSALYELVDAIENDSGAEPSKSVYDRALDAAKELACYRSSLQDSEV